MDENQNNNDDNNQGRGGRYAKIGGGAVATGLFVSALMFGVYSITTTGGDDARSESASPAVAAPASDVATDDAPGEDEPGVIDTPAEDRSNGPADHDEVVSAPDPVGLSKLCLNVVHDDTSSGIWVRGEVYGLDLGWIYVEGPTVNGGRPVQVPVESGTFDSPLPIVQYGDHEVTRFELVPDGPDALAVDLMSALNDGPGTVFPVGADDGSIFDSECFDIEPTEPVAPSDDAADAPVASEVALVEEFMDGFVEDHRTNDVAGLLSTLHPAVPLSFGDDVCTQYVERTTGSIVAATVVEVGQIGPLEMDTPAGPIGFPESIPFRVEFELTDGSSMSNDAHLPLHNGTVHWVTTCGITDTP